MLVVFEEEGSLDIMTRARDGVNKLLSTWHLECIDVEIDTSIRAKLPIKPDPRDMRSGNGNW